MWHFFNNDFEVEIVKALNIQTVYFEDSEEYGIWGNDD